MDEITGRRRNSGLMLFELVAAFITYSAKPASSYLCHPKILL
jgi:hypothetical protein